MKIIPISRNSPGWIWVLYALWEAQKYGDHTPYMPNGYVNIPSIRKRLAREGFFYDAIGQRISDLRLKFGVKIRCEKFDCSKSPGYCLTTKLTAKDWVEILAEKSNWRNTKKTAQMEIV